QVITYPGKLNQTRFAHRLDPVRKSSRKWISREDFGVIRKRVGPDHSGARASSVLLKPINPRQFFRELVSPSFAQERAADRECDQETKSPLCADVNPISIQIPEQTNNGHIGEDGIDIVLHPGITVEPSVENQVDTDINPSDCYDKTSPQTKSGQNEPGIICLP